MKRRLVFSKSAMIRRRQSLGLTQPQVAERLGCSQQKISALELGTRSPTIAALGDLASVLRVQPNDLLTWEGE